MVRVRPGGFRLSGVRRENRLRRGRCSGPGRGPLWRNHGNRRSLVHASCRKVSLFRQGHEGTGASQALLFMTCCCNRHEKHDVSTMFLGKIGVNLVARGRVQV